MSNAIAKLKLELVNHHGKAGYNTGLAGYELVNLLVLVACL